MPRSEFMKTGGRTAALLVLGTAAANCSDKGETMDRKLRFATLAEASKELDALEKAKEVKLAGAWSVYKVLSHCAQSIEFSLSKFPKYRAAIFRNTVGKIAFSVFNSRGYMSHNLNEVIPGAPEIKNEGDVKEALARLRKAMADFETHSGEYGAHFVFDKLSKAEYERAHAFHIANHLSAMEFVS